MFRNRSAGKPVLVADIGDGGISISLVALTQHAPAHVIRSLRATLPIEERTKEQAAAAIAKQVEETLTKFLTVSTTKDSKAEVVESIHVIMRSPWTRFRTVRANDAFASMTTITKDIVAATAKKALETPSQLERSAILEAGVLQVFLNGYPTANPIGKKAQAISVVAFESDIDAALRSTLTSIIGKQLPARAPQFHSGMRSLLMVMHERLPDVPRFLLLDIGGSTTSVAVIRKDEITQYATVPEGLTTLLKRVSQGGLPEETLTLLRMLANDTCSTSACQAVKDSLAKAEPELVRAFGEVFASLAATRRLPNAALLSVPSELAPWMEGFFSRIDFSQFTATTKPFNIEPLSPEHLKDFVNWETGVVPDAGVGVAAAAVNILFFSR